MSTKIDMLSPEGEAKWDAYVNQSGASFYHYSTWRHLIKDVFGHDSYYIYATDDQNHITGILPLVRLKSLLFGNFLVSMPYFNYGGVVSDSVEVDRHLLEKAESLRVELGCSHLELRESKDRKNELPAKTDKVTMLLGLPGDPEELWKAIGAKRRAQVKRPIREGADFFFGGEELLDDFYTVFSINMRDLGTPVYSKRFFKNILDKFPKQAFIAIVRIKGVPVGAGFLLGNNGRIEIPWASTLRKYNKFGVNMFLYWNILKTAIEKQYKVFDFGRSSKDAGTLKFKKQWGAIQEQLYWNYLLPQGESLPEINPNNPKYSLVINVWQKLPLFVTRLLGPAIVKSLP